MTTGTIARGALALATSLLLLAARRAPGTVFDLDRVGKPVPDVAIPLADGRPLALAALAGKPAYVFLLASWCGPCALTIPWIRDAYARYGDRVRFIGIDVLDDRRAARAYLDALALPFEVAIVEKSAIDAVVNDDARLAAGDKYRLPADYLIDAGGVVRAAWHGVPVTREGTPIDVLPERLGHVGIVPALRR